MCITLTLTVDLSVDHFSEPLKYSIISSYLLWAVLDFHLTYILPHFLDPLYGFKTDYIDIFTLDNVVLILKAYRWVGT